MTVLTEPQTPDRVRRLTPLAVGTTIVAAATVALHVRDPHVTGSWGFCPWLLLTGTYCPGCGGLRAVNDLTDGDVLAAASSNLLFVASLPFVAWWWLRSLVRGWRGATPTPNLRRATRVATVFAVAAVVFTVARNLPLGAWLAP